MSPQNPNLSIFQNKFKLHQFQPIKSMTHTYISHHKYYWNAVTLPFGSIHSNKNYVFMWNSCAWNHLTRKNVDHRTLTSEVTYQTLLSIALLPVTAMSSYINFVCAKSMEKNIYVNRTLNGNCPRPDTLTEVLFHTALKKQIFPLFLPQIHFATFGIYVWLSHDSHSFLCAFQTWGLREKIMLLL